MIQKSSLPQLSNVSLKQQQGFTLVELMVALALSLLVVLASVSALLVSRTGFTNVDATSQLRDNARFATDFITRLALQSGYKDAVYAADKRTTQSNISGVGTVPSTPIFGFNNATIGIIPTDPINSTVNESRNTGACTSQGTACANGSDILVMSYQTGSLNTGSTPGSVNVDNAMFNCSGASPTQTVTSGKDSGITSILFVGRSAVNNEPTLMCKYMDPTGAAWVPQAVSLVEGVESFQVLYGTDGVVPNTPPVATPTSIPNRYLRATELTVAGNPTATTNNWKRVRSLRIGMILRGAPGSAQDRNLTAVNQPLFPFGKSTLPGDTSTSPNGMFDANDAQTRFIQIPATGDGRLRQTLTFTVYLHNFQGS